jgi:pantoate--beta-alanine ligase
MLTVHDLPALNSALVDAGRPVALVPTMGALHAGHLSLVDRARADCTTVVVSIFVNPLQFGPDEDLASYPRTLDDDLAALDKEGVDLVFVPDPDFAPEESTIRLEGITATLEGASRLGHFAGVMTIVHRLLSAVEPDRAYFGEKDFQQLAVLRAMVAEHGLSVDIVGCPIVRDRDGLALSSRNAYLSSSERMQALHIPAALKAVAGAWDGDADTARVRLRRRLEDASDVRLDYAEIVDPETFQPLEGVVTGPAQALVAAYVGATRLIDNIRLEPQQ